MQFIELSRKIRTIKIEAKKQGFKKTKDFYSLAMNEILSRFRVNEISNVELWNINNDNYSILIKVGRFHICMKEEIKLYLFRNCKGNWSYEWLK